MGDKRRTKNKVLHILTVFHLLCETIFLICVKILFGGLMVNQKLYAQICQLHKEEIGEILYLFLYENMSPILITPEIIKLKVDTFSLPYLEKNNHNYQMFEHTLQQLLFSDQFELSFVSEFDQEVLSNNEKITELTKASPINNEVNNPPKTQSLEAMLEAIEQPISSSNIIKDPNLESATQLFQTNLANNLTFNNFFYSYENKQIVDAAKLLIDTIDNPHFNPLFIYGSSGIGKTHILNAIGNQLHDQYPNKKILYLHSQTFIDEFQSLFNGATSNTNRKNEFKNKYNSIDILLMDDIQHLEGKELTIQEFFGIFEKMRNNNKIVVLASDKHPEKINFEERLITRFISGLTCEMKIPDSNTKKVIFQHHAQKRNFTITDTAINIFIKNSTNVRALIGYLNAITLYLISNDVEELEITEEIAQIILNKNKGHNQKFTDEDILKIIADYFNIKISDIRSRKRNHNIVNARHFSAYFLRQHLNLKHSKIAYSLGFKDHSAALNAIKAAEEKFEKDEFKKDYRKLNQIINKY